MPKTTHVYGAAFDGYTFAYQQSPLETCVRLGNQQVPTGADYPVPGNPLFARAGRHRVAGSSSPAAQAERFSDVAVRGDTPTGNFLHKSVYRLP